MRTEPAVLIAAASPWLNQAISPALNELARASTAIRITASPARAGRELRNQRIISAGPGKFQENRACGTPGQGFAADPGRATSKELSTDPCQQKPWRKTLRH